MNPEPTKMLSARLPAKLIDGLKKEAGQKRMKIQGLLEQIIAEHQNARKPRRAA